MPEVLKYFQLTVAQHIHELSWTRRAGLRFQTFILQCPCDILADIALALHHRVNGLKNRLGYFLLHHVAERARTQCASRVNRFIMH